MLVSPRSLLKIVRSGNALERLRAVRDGQAAIRVAAVGGALSTGVLHALRRPRTTADLAEEIGARDVELLQAFLRALTAAGLVRTVDGVHRLTRRSRAVLGDDVVRAAYEGFSDFHTGLYRDLPAQLAGGRARDDVTRRGDVIARLSRAMEPLVHDALATEVRESGARRLLDVGCGDGSHLVHMLAAAPEAEGVGVEIDPAAAALAVHALATAGLSDRGRVLTADVREVVAEGVEALGGPVDLALVANVIYYLPVEERTGLLRAVGGLLAPGGRLVVVSTMAGESAFSRHFDLLLRAQDGEMALPTPVEVATQLTDAGLEATSIQRLAPGDPLYAVIAQRPGPRPAGT